MPPGIPEILWLQKTPRDLRGREDGRGGRVWWREGGGGGGEAQSSREVAE